MKKQQSILHNMKEDGDDPALTSVGWGALLLLSNGLYFQGIGYGKKSMKQGEVVFNTSMTGYQEILTDPSYMDQMVVMTHPHIGNTGINIFDNESKTIYLQTLITKNLCIHPSHPLSQSSLLELAVNNSATSFSLKNAALHPTSELICLDQINTRLLTQVLREEGAMSGLVIPEEILLTSSHTTTNTSEDIQHTLRALLKDKLTFRMQGQNLVEKVSTKTIYEYKQKNSSSSLTDDCILVYDFGVKESILERLADKKVRVHVVPHDFHWKNALSMKPKAIVLSNGPGDPAAVTTSIHEITSLLGKIPILAICMGHQLLAHALGGTTYKLTCGHHGANHPVYDTKMKTTVISSHNHGFSVDKDSLASLYSNKDNFIPRFINLNDQSLEGFELPSLKLLSVQFHPEAHPGPEDTQYIFDEFFSHYVYPN